MGDGNHVTNVTNELENKLAARAGVALVTGASGGIGYELAKLLARDGYRLLLVARQAARLGAVAGECRALGSPSAEAILADLADPAAPPRLFDQVAGGAADGALDVLVNCAGFGTLGPFAQADWPQQAGLLQVNMVALAHLTRLFLPAMLRRGRGRILNVASTASFVPGPLMAAYYASKAFVLSFSEAVASEVAGGGVTLTALCPGPTATGFQARAGVTNSPLFRANTMTAAAVARAGYRGMLRGKRLVIPGLKNRLLTFATRLAPRRLTTAIARKLNAGR